MSWHHSSLHHASSIALCCEERDWECCRTSVRTLSKPSRPPLVLTSQRRKPRPISFSKRCKSSEFCSRPDNAIKDWMCCRRFWAISGVVFEVLEVDVELASVFGEEMRGGGEFVVNKSGILYFVVNLHGQCCCDFKKLKQI